MERAECRMTLCLHPDCFPGTNSLTVLHPVRPTTTHAGFVASQLEIVSDCMRGLCTFSHNETVTIRYNRSISSAIHSKRFVVIYLDTMNSILHFHYWLWDMILWSFLARNKKNKLTDWFMTDFFSLANHALKYAIKKTTSHFQEIYILAIWLQHIY